MKIDCTRPCILIWTKEDSLREDISSLLGEEGFKTRKVSDRYEMFRLLEEYQPSIVILDSDLPKIMDFEVYELIKRIDRFKDIKVVVISSTPHSNLNAAEYVEYMERGQVQDLLLSKVRAFIPDEFMDSNTTLSEPERPMHEEARRFARIIVSDIVLYNKDKAERGAKDGTFHELLKKEIEEGRQFYSTRVPGVIRAATNYYDEAIEEFIQKLSK